MSTSIPPKAPPAAADVMAQLAAARDEVAQAAAKTRALRKQSLAEAEVQVARLAHDRGETGQGQALADEAERIVRPALDLKI